MERETVESNSGIVTYEIQCSTYSSYLRQGCLNMAMTGGSVSGEEGRPGFVCEL